MKAKEVASLLLVTTKTNQEAVRCLGGLHDNLSAQ